MKRVAIYTRVSSEGQAKEGKTSLDEQKRICMEWLDKIGGCTLIGTYVDGGAGGTYRSRPAMDTIMSLAREKKIDAVLVGKADRWAREPAIADILRFDLNALGCEFMLVDRDLTTPQGKMVMTFETTFAAMDRDRLVEKLQSNKRAHLKKGDFMGSGFSPYGYLYSKDLKTLVIDQSESEWVIQIFQWIGEGLSMQKVADKLNRFGVPTKRNGKNGWQATTIKQMLDNPVYKGEFGYYKTESSVRIGSIAIGIARERKTSHIRRDKSEWITISVPALVSAELWQACQEIREINKKTSNRNIKLDYLLRAGLLKCYCGNAYHGTTSHDRRIYRCNGIKPSAIAKSGKRCDSPSIRADELETWLWTKIIKRLETIADPSTLFDDDLRQQEAEKAQTLALLEMAMKQENEINDESVKLLNLYTKGMVNDSVYEIKYNELESRRKSCLAIKAEFEEQLKEVALKIDTESLERLSAGAPAMLDYDHDQKRSILELLQTKVMVNRDGTFDIHGLITDSLLDAIDFYAGVKEAQQEIASMLDAEGLSLSIQKGLDNLLQKDYELEGDTVWNGTQDLAQIEAIKDAVGTYKKE